jgi:hypothetical protein
MILFVMLLTVTLQAQPKAFATLKPDRVETGDTFLLTVIVSGVKTSPKDVDFVSWANILPANNILRRSEWRKTGSQWVRQFTLISFDSSSLELPSLTILQSVGTPLYTNTLSLTVFPSAGKELADMAQMRDIYREPVSWLDYWPLAVGALLMLLLGYWFLRRAKRRVPVVVAAPVIPSPTISATEIALTKLQELQNRQAWKKGDIKEHYAELSLIVREYLENQYHFQALESTTIEIGQLLSSLNMSKSQISAYSDILSQTDMVKYAQSQPPENTHDAIIEKARTLILPIPKPTLQQNPNPTHNPTKNKRPPTNHQRL